MVTEKVNDSAEPKGKEVPPNVSSADELFNERAMDELRARSRAAYTERVISPVGEPINFAAEDLYAQGAGTRFESKRADGRGYATTVGEPNRQTYFGPRQSDNFVLQRTAGGAYEIRVSESAEPLKLSGDQR